jgi:FAD:protein FMN transferase
MGALVSLTAQSMAGSEQLFFESRQAMGTTFTIYLYAADGEQASAYFDAAFEEIERLDEALSNYRASSELSRINRMAGQEPVTTDPEIFQLLERSLAYGRRSGGAFDITVGPLMRAWGFFRGEGSYPGADDLAKARASVGWQHVVLDPATRTVRFFLPALELDLGGIGKGYAVDSVVALLREMGVKSALLDAGSSTIYAIGAPPGKPGWNVRVPQPGNRLQTISTVVLRDTSLSTSGTYEKFFCLHGHIYGHIMNPQTGEPVQGVLQTTVIAPEATDSDALSTAVFVMGPVRGKRLLQGVAGARAFWVLGNPQVPRTATWRWPGRDCGNPMANCAVSSPVATQHHREREQGRQR